MTVHKFTVKEVELINFKKRRYVRQLTQNAIRCGQLIRPLNCDLCCCEGMMQAHHIDYGRPYHVAWLCRQCHTKAHTKDHPLNPNNNEQTPMPYIVEQYQKIHITFDIPIKTYLALKQESERTGRAISSLMREKAEEAFPVYNPQLEFKLEENNDQSPNVSHERIQGVETHEGLRDQPERAILQEVRRTRNYNMQGMEQQLYPILNRYGGDARRLQRPVASR